ncbi:hypothetical protein VTO42DRAFT_1931 [Malbranchea cinnamomea]
MVSVVQNTIEKYGILPEHIYNFDAVSFPMGIIATTRVVTGSEKNLCPNLIQPGNREWVTVIEGVNACGWFLPSMFILKGKNHQASWYQTEGLPDRGVIGIGENGGSLPPQYSDAYQMHTPTPPGTSHSSQASWATATPHNVRQLELQSEKVKKYLKRRT